jgi:hypothetical protein
VSEREQERAKGIACRHGDGWHIIVQAASRQASTPDRTHGFVAGENDPVTSYGNEIMGGISALGIEDEEQLIKNVHWKRTP